MIRCDPPDEAVVFKRLGPRTRSYAHKALRKLKQGCLWVRFQSSDIAHKLRDGLFRPEQISLSELRRGMEARNIGTRIC
jgi:hypothetical protein